jgi:nitroreductase
MTSTINEPLTTEEVSVLTGAAGAAPSIHNTQPWLFDVEGQSIRLYEDATNALPVADPFGRQRLMSCGAALLNARVAASHLGWAPRVSVLPDPTHPTLTATVTRSRDSSNADDAGLYDEIFRRRTHRRSFGRKPVPDDAVRQLTLAAAAEGATLVHVPEGERRVALLGIIVQALDDEAANDAYRAELADWLRNRPGSVDGIPYGALAPQRQLEPDHPLDVFARSQHPASVSATGALFVLCTRSDDPHAWLAAGQALQRALLTATQLNLVASPCGAPVEIPAARKRLTMLLGGDLLPQLVLRVGSPAGVVPGSQRRR